MPDTQLIFIVIIIGSSELIKRASRTGINGFDKNSCDSWKPKLKTYWT